MTKIKKVSVGIPAHNEEANIGSLIKSVLSQDEKNYKLLEILVMGDGCTDATEKIVSSFEKQDKRVRGYFDSKQKGKQCRMNKYIDISKGDIIVSIDADVVLKEQTTLTNLISSFDENVGLVGSNDQPAPAKSFLQHVNATLEVLWYEIRKDVNNGDTIHNQRGRMFGMKKEFAKKLDLPEKTLDDFYIYLKCKELGYKFKLANDAIVLFAAPATIKDLLGQSKRNVDLTNLTLEQFGISHEDKTILISNKQHLKGVLRAFISRPISTPLALLLIFLVQHNPIKFNNVKETGAWADITSTKTNLGV